MHRDIEPASPSRSHVRTGRSVIAVIGIDQCQYREWPRLENAVSDAMGALKLFTRLGFELVTAPLLNESATGGAMRRLVTDDLAKLAKDDSLVLFFAGHGHTHTTILDSAPIRTGCVIPFDAMPPRGHVSASWLQLDSWLRDIARLPPRHILVIIDSCYSGIALSVPRWRGGPGVPKELDALRSRRSRIIIASALDDQRAMDSGPVVGHSLFTGCLIEGISGGCARPGQRVVTGKEIGQYLQQRVRSYSHSAQTPDYGSFELDKQGDIIVPLLDEVAPASAAMAAAVPSTSSAAATLAVTSARVPMGLASSRQAPKAGSTAPEFSVARTQRSKIESTAPGYDPAPSPFSTPVPAAPGCRSPPASPASPEIASLSEPPGCRRCRNRIRARVSIVPVALVTVTVASLVFGYMIFGPTTFGGSSTESKPESAPIVPLAPDASLQDARASTTAPEPPHPAPEPTDGQTDPTSR
jgi:uncharacterized caspase-like protein